jgi:hypothetical protein
MISGLKTCLTADRDYEENYNIHFLPRSCRKFIFTNKVDKR